MLGVLCACSTKPVVLQRGAPDDGIWSLTGRLGVSAGNRHGNFTVDWRQHKEAYQIDLLGPMGIGVAHIAGDTGKVTLQVPRQPPMTAASAEDLLARSLGLDIPITPLRYWVRGKPAPGAYERMPDGFSQLGWKVEYLAYVRGLPTRIRMTRPEVRLLMVVRQWIN